MINLKIDGKEVQIASGATILDAAETLGIKIPTLCYLKKVSPTGACRVCAVEVEGADKTMTAFDESWWSCYWSIIPLIAPSATLEANAICRTSATLRMLCASLSEPTTLTPRPSTTGR